MAASEAKPALEGVDLIKHYPASGGGRRRGRVVHAVDGVSVALWPGRTLGVVGESGSGKSTVAKLLSLLVTPTSGTIRLDGEAVDPRRAEAVRAYHGEVQMVFQDPFASLNPAKSIEYILSRPLYVHGRARTSRQAYEILTELLTSVGLTPPDDFLAKYPHELSGGQRQRVGFARALASGGRVLLADEPVSMLDVSIRAEVLNLMARLRDQKGLALMYITHDLASARYLSDDIMVMYAGEVVEFGPADEVVSEALHPYTQLLLASVPDPEAGLREDSRADVAALGEAPNMAAPPAGCRFHPRCPYATDICRSEAPSTGRKGTHWVRCHLYDQNARLRAPLPMAPGRTLPTTPQSPTPQA
jgi:peptide/nickel transport system ATP-binding protein